MPIQEHACRSRRSLDVVDDDEGLAHNAGTILFSLVVSELYYVARVVEKRAKVRVQWPASNKCAQTHKTNKETFKREPQLIYNCESRARIGTRFAKTSK